MKASVHIEYDNGIVHVDGVVNGRTAHLRVDFTKEPPIAVLPGMEPHSPQDRVEAHIQMVCAMVPAFAWHQATETCAKCANSPCRTAGSPCP